jgi:hypothetical protein
MHRIALDQKDFSSLVRGEAVMVKAHDGEPIEIALKDIGYDIMMQTVQNASMGIDRDFDDD